MCIIICKIRAYSCSLNYLVAVFFKGVSLLIPFCLLLQINPNPAQRFLVFIRLRTGVASPATPVEGQK